MVEMSNNEDAEEATTAAAAFPLKMIYPATMDESFSSLVSAITLDRDLASVSSEFCSNSKQERFRRFSKSSNSNDFMGLPKPRRTLSNDDDMDVIFASVCSQQQQQQQSDGGDKSNPAQDSRVTNDAETYNFESPCRRSSRYATTLGDEKIIDRIKEELHGEGDSTSKDSSACNDMDSKEHPPLVVDAILPGGEEGAAHRGSIWSAITISFDELPPMSGEFGDSSSSFRCNNHRPLPPSRDDDNENKSETATDVIGAPSQSPSSHLASIRFEPDVSSPMASSSRKKFLSNLLPLIKPKRQESEQRAEDDFLDAPVPPPPSYLASTRFDPDVSPSSNYKKFLSSRCPLNQPQRRTSQTEAGRNEQHHNQQRPWSLFHSAPTPITSPLKKPQRQRSNGCDNIMSMFIKPQQQNHHDLCPPLTRSSLNSRVSTASSTMSRDPPSIPMRKASVTMVSTVDEY